MADCIVLNEKFNAFNTLVKFNDIIILSNKLCVFCYELLLFSLIKLISYHKTEIWSVNLCAVEPNICVDHNNIPRVDCSLHVTMTLPPTLGRRTK